MADSNELQFILKMRDEASAILKQHAQAFSQAGSGAKQLKDNADEATHSIEDLARYAKEATEAVLALWTANEMAHKSIEAFSEYEQGMLTISRTTQISGEAMKDFQAEFDKMAARTRGVKPEALLEFAAVAGQLGIRGKEDVLGFAETVGKLTTVTNIAGEEGAKQFGRLLLLTGEGAGGVQKLADSLTGLQADTKASASEILRMASTVAQTTAGFNVTTATLTGMAAAAAQLNMEPFLFSNAAGRALRELRDGALNNTKGFQELSAAIGMSREDFIQLMNTKPEMALMKFLDVLRQTNSAGNSATGFLQKFQLQGDESQKVLITLAQHLDEVNGKIQESKNLQGGSGALNNAYEGFSKTIKADLDGATTAVTQFWVRFGAGVAPSVKTILSGVTGLVNGINSAFDAMPKVGQEIVTWGVVAVPALVGIQKAATLTGELFGGLRGVLLGAAGGFGSVAAEARAAATSMEAAGAASAAAGAGGAAAGAAGVAGAAATGAQGKSMWQKATGGTMRAAGGIAAAIGLKEPAEELGGWLGEKIADGLIAYTPNFARKLNTFMNGGAQKAKEEAPKPKPAESGHHAPANTPSLGENKAVDDLTTDQTAALAQLDTYRKLDQQIKDATTALEALERLSARSPGASDARSADEIARIRGRIEIEKRQLDPAQDRARLLGIEADKTEAITAAEKNQLEVENEIRALREKRGAITEAEVEKIQAAVAILQQSRQNATVRQENFNNQNQLAEAKALTQTEKDRVAIAQQLVAFEREHGKLSAENRDALIQQLTTLKQIVQYTAQMDNLNPQAKGIRDYNEQLTILNARLRQGLITQQEYNREKTKLDNDTLAARNPLGSIVQQQKEEIAQLAIIGDYQEADRQSAQQVLELKKQGLEVTRQTEESIKNYNRAIADAQQRQNSGFEGWAKQVGSMEKGLLDLESTFASGLSDSVVNALSGKKGVWTQLGQTLGQSMLKFGVNQLMKQAFEKLNINDLFGMGSKQALNAAGKAAEGLGDSAARQVADTASQADQMSKALQSMTTASMTVQAASVVVNGAGFSGAGAPSSGSMPGASDVNIASVGGNSITSGATNDNSPFGGLLGQGFSTLNGSGIAGIGTIGALASGASRFGLNGVNMSTGLGASNVGGMLGLRSAAGLSTSNLGSIGSDSMKAFGAIQGMNVSPSKALDLSSASGREMYGMQYYISHGYSPEQAAAKMANFKAESTNSSYDPNSFSPNDAGPGKHSYGIGQWNRERWTGLQDFAKKETGKPYDQLSADEKFKQQLAFGRHEDMTNPRYRQAWENVGKNPGREASAYGTVYEGYNKDTAHGDAWRDQQYGDILQRYRSGASGQTLPQGQLAGFTPDQLKGLDEQTIKSISGLKPEMQKVIIGAHMLNPDQKFTMGADQGFRTPEMQNEIFRRGASSLDGYKRVSEHQSGRAGDMTLYDKNGNPITRGEDPAYAQWNQSMQESARQQGVGVHWGGAFSRPDPDHWELLKRGNVDRTPTGSISGMGQAQNLMRQQQQQMQQAGQSMQQSLKQAQTSMTNLGQHASQAAPKITTMGTDITQLTPKITETAPQFTKFGTSLQGMTGELAQGPGVMNSFSSSLQQMLSQMGGMGGGMGGGLLGAIGGLFHEGGIVGGGVPASGFRAVASNTWTHASRYHTGLKDDEYPAILQKGERVLTANDNARQSKLITGLTEAMSNAKGGASGNGGQEGGKTVNQHVTFNVTTPNADSFRRSKSQLLADTGTHMQRYSQANN